MLKSFSARFSPFNRIVSAGTLVAAIAVLVCAGFVKPINAAPSFFASVTEFLGLSSPASPTAVVKVSPSNLQGWTTQTGTVGTTNTSAQQYVYGPATPPAGVGSLRVTIGTDGGSFLILRNPNYDLVPVSSLTTLTYSTYVTFNTGSQAHAISLELDTDNDGIKDDRLWFEPAYQGPGFFTPSQGPLTTGTWQTWNALAGGWYTETGVGGATPGTGVKSLPVILAAIPNARIVNVPAGGGVRLYTGAGDPDWNNFDGNADNLTIGTAALTTTFDFDPDVSTLVVDDLGVNCVDMTPTTYLTIQSGINAANPGDTVRVCPGTYVENVTLNKSITLVGAQSGVDARGRVAVESIVTPLSAARALELQTGSAGSVINGFTFSGGTLVGTSGLIESTSGPLNNLQILNNRFVSFPGRAVNLNDTGTDITVSQNSFDATGNTAAVSGVFHLDTDGFNGFQFTNNSVFNADFTEGLYVDGNHNVGPNGARIPTISGNLFNNNNVGMNLGSRAFGSFTIANAGLISNNTFSNNNFDGVQGGIQNVLVTGNMFLTNGRSGIALTSFGNTAVDRGGQNSDIISNTFIGNVREGIFFTSTQAAGTIQTNEAHFNRIVDNVIGVTYTGTGAPIDVQNNWWGCNLGPNTPGCDTTSGANLDFNPWLVLRTNANPNPIPAGGTSLITADMRFNSDNVDTSAMGTLPDTPVTFQAVNGTMNPPSGTVQAGTEDSTFTSNGSAPAQACSTVDGEQVCTPITVILPPPTFTISDVALAEGNTPGGTTAFTFTVTISADPPTATTVQYQTQDLSAVAPVDYLPAAGSLRFIPGGPLTQQVTVTVNQDLTVEADEAFFVNLFNPVNATIVDAYGRGTIINDDSPTGCTPVPTGLAAWYSAEGNANDRSVYANNGVFQPTPADAAYTTGKVNQAFDFTGTNNVRAPYSTSLDVGVGAGLTVDAWIRPDDLSTQQPIAEWNNGSTYGVHFWQSVTYGGAQAPGNLYVNLVDRATGTQYLVYTNPDVLVQGVYQFVAFTYDKTTGEARIYINGTAVPVGTGGAAPSATFVTLGSFSPQTGPGYDFYIGHRPSQGMEYYNGAVDELEVFNREISATDLQAIAAAGSAGKCNPLTDADVAVSGRVITSGGRGIRGAFVTVTGNSLVSPINVMTGVNGRYTVPGLTAGETYVVTVRSRRFFFEQPSRVVTLNDNVDDADFTGTSGTSREQ